MTLVAVGQLNSGYNMAANAIAACRLITQAAQRGAKLILLPEASDYIAKNAKHSKTIVAAYEDSPFIQGILPTIAQLGTIDVAVGIHEPTDEEPHASDGLSRTKNTLVYINNRGQLVSRYHKVHLFDVDIPGGAIMKESNSVQPGKGLEQPVQTPAGKLGLAICYDLRFPKLALKQRELGAEMIAYPSAWTMKTGKHFVPLGVGTAIFSQSYVLLAGQVGTHGDTGRESWGRSCIISPDGVVLAQVADQTEGIAVAEVDLGLVAELRTKIPTMLQEAIL